MRAARLILITVATCALVAALGTLAFAAASHDEPDLGQPVHLGSPGGAATGSTGPGPGSPTPHRHTRPTPTKGPTGSADADDDDDDGAQPPRVSVRHAGDDDDDDADDAHDGDRGGDHDGDHDDDGHEAGDGD